jgi:hypothetical protein
MALRRQAILSYMTNQFTEFLSTIKDHELRLQRMEGYNQIKTIKDANGDTIIDTGGLNSVSNFKKAQAFSGASGLSTGSTSPQDVPGSSLPTLTVSRTTRVLFCLTGYGYNSDYIDSEGVNRIEVQLYDSFSSGGVSNLITGGSAMTNVYTVGVDLFINEIMQDQIVSRATLLDVEAGTHDYKLQYRAINGGTAFLNSWEVLYIAFGA